MKYCTFDCMNPFVSRNMCLLPVLLLFLASNYLAAQDTLILVDRAPRPVHSVEIGEDHVFYRKPGKKKKHVIRREMVFSLRSSGAPEQIIYRQDSLEGNEYTVEQMRDFLRGQADARAGCIKRSNRLLWIGSAIGVGGSTISPFFSPLLIVGYPYSAGLLRPSLNEENGYNPAYRDNPFYREGYLRAARRMATRRALAGTAGGFILGFTLFSLIL